MHKHVVHHIFSRLGFLTHMIGLDMSESVIVRVINKYSKQHGMATKNTNMA